MPEHHSAKVIDNRQLNCINELIYADRHRFSAVSGQVLVANLSLVRMCFPDQSSTNTTVWEAGKLVAKSFYESSSLAT